MRAGQVVRVWTRGPFWHSYRGAGFTEHEDGDLVVQRSGRVLAIYPKGAWRRVALKGARRP